MKRYAGHKQRMRAINRARGWTYRRKPGRFILSSWTKYPKRFFAPVRQGADSIQPVLPDGTPITITARKD